MPSVIDKGPIRRTDSRETHGRYEAKDLPVPKNIEKRPLRLPPVVRIKK